MRLFHATRPCAGQTANGDAWCSFANAAGTRIAVIDGAGHGPQAARAGAAGLATLQEHADLPLPDVMRLCHATLLGTRGAVLSVLEIREGQLEFAGVGNVEGRIFTPSQAISLPPARGLLGMVLPTVRPLRLPVGEPWFAFLFTDGISQRFLHGMTYERAAEGLASLPDEIVAEWGRQTDDATIVVVSSA
jgi:hypothetical protein